MNRCLPLVALVSLAAGCERVDYIEILPEQLVLRQKNNEIWLQAKAMSHTGVHYSRTHVGWSTKDPSIAVVDEKGRLTGVKSGRTEVVAVANKVVATAPVEVLFAEKITVEPASLTLVEGGPSQELSVKVLDYQGRELKDRTPTFRSGDKEVVSMGQNAAFPVNAGQSYVEVMVEELRQKVEVKVEPEKAVAKKK